MPQKITGNSFEIVLGDGGHDNHVAIIYNTSLFSVEDFKSESVFKRYINNIDSWVLDSWRPVADICLKEKVPHSNEPKTYRIIIAHVSSAGEGDTYKSDRLTELQCYHEVCLYHARESILKFFNLRLPRIEKPIFAWVLKSVFK